MFTGCRTRGGIEITSENFPNSCDDPKCTSCRWRDEILKTEMRAFRYYPENGFSRFRRKGVTTQIVDRAIQILFTYGEIKVPFAQESPDYMRGRNEDKRPIWILDHAAYTASLFRNAQRDIFQKISDRLNLEHREQFSIKRENHYYLIRLKNYGEYEIK